MLCRYVCLHRSIVLDFFVTFNILYRLFMFKGIAESSIYSVIKSLHCPPPDTGKRSRLGLELMSSEASAKCVIRVSLA